MTAYDSVVESTTRYLQHNNNNYTLMVPRRWLFFYQCHQVRCSIPYVQYFVYDQVPAKLMTSSLTSARVWIWPHFSVWTQPKTKGVVAKTCILYFISKPNPSLSLNGAFLVRPLVTTYRSKLQSPMTITKADIRVLQSSIYFFDVAIQYF